MSELQRVGGLEKVKKQLSGAGGVSFKLILNSMKTVELSPFDREAISRMVIIKIAEFIRYGNWDDLEGGKECLEFLGVEGLQASDSFTKKLAELYGRFSYGFLVSLSPNLYNGKCWVHGRGYVKYEQVWYTRMKLRELGIPEEEITDELAGDIWTMRELMILMHINNVKLANSITMNDLLALPQQTGRY